MKVNKTMKLYINGKFPRGASGETFELYEYKKKNTYARISIAGSKDLKTAIAGANKAQSSWEKRDAFNRSQILYRVGEMLEGKKGEFIQYFKKVLGYTEKKSLTEFEKGRDAWVYYAGFCDKYKSLLSCVNDVSGPFHNFSTPSSQGVIIHFSTREFSFERLCASLASIVTGGNTLVSLLEKEASGLISLLGETFATSDMPAGVINLLSGHSHGLYASGAAHREVHGLLYEGDDLQITKDLQANAIGNMKRVIISPKDILSLNRISDHLETKTVWESVGAWVSGSGSY